MLWGRWEHVDAALRRPEATALAVGPAGLQWHPGFQGVSAHRPWLDLHTNAGGASIEVFAQRSL